MAERNSSLVTENESFLNQLEACVANKVLDVDAHMWQMVRNVPNCAKSADNKLAVTVIYGTKYLSTCTTQHFLLCVICHVPALEYKMQLHPDGE